MVIINSRYRAEGICPGYQNPCLHFAGLWKFLFAFYQATKAICQKFLKVRGTNTCSYLRTYKESKARNQIRKHCNIYFIHLYILNKKLYYLYNIAEVMDGRLKSKFKSPNDFHLSTRILSKAEICLLSKGLKFIPTQQM